MKLSKRVTGYIAAAFLGHCLFCGILQVVLLTMKCTGARDIGWLHVFAPTICFFGLPLAALVVLILVLIPIAMWKSWKTTKRVNAEAEKYGMKRLPGESNSDLKKRIARRNMLSGNYSRKDIKDMILDKYPAVGSCMISVNNYNKTITLVLRRAYTAEPGAGFTDDELCEIASFAAKYIPMDYTITARNA